jgi:flagellar P-ring protein FlgI
MVLAFQPAERWLTRPHATAASQGSSMFKRLALAIVALAACAGPAAAASRVKDIVAIEGVRDNQLVGYGLVVGLQGTGDSLRNSAFTKQSIQGMLERLGVNTRDANLNTKNVAAVMVTANLPAFAAAGSRLDATVSSIGDAKSLLGGTLLVTALSGADGETYAVAQGSIVTGGFSAEGSSGSSVTKGVPTAGRIANGATVEREVAFRMRDMRQVRLTLRNPDFTTALRIAEAVNGRFPGSARADNPTIVTVAPPQGADMVGFLTAIEQLPVEVDTPAKVVIDEASGVIVMGENVRVSTVAIAQGSLTISVQETPQVSQPEPLGDGETVVVPRSEVTAEETGKEMRILKNGASLATLVEGLNALGVGPRDLISILQTLKAAGALQAEIEVM